MHYYRLHLVFTDYFSLLTITAHYYRLQTYYYLFIVFYSIITANCVNWDSITFFYFVLLQYYVFLTSIYYIITTRLLQIVFNVIQLLCITIIHYYALRINSIHYYTIIRRYFVLLQYYVFLTSIYYIITTQLLQIVCNVIQLLCITTNHYYSLRIKSVHYYGIIRH